MKINIKAHNLELTPAIRSYIDDKLVYLEKLLDPADETVLAEVEIEKTDHHHRGLVFRAEINLKTRTGQFFSQETMEDLYAAIDIVKDEVADQLRKASKRRISLVRRGGRRLKTMFKSINPWKRN